MSKGRADFCGKIGFHCIDDCGASATAKSAPLFSARCHFIVIFLRCLWSGRPRYPSGDGLVLI